MATAKAVWAEVVSISHNEQRRKGLEDSVRTLVLEACLFIFGAYVGVCIVERAGYSNGFEKGYGDGIKAARVIVEGRD